MEVLSENGPLPLPSLLDRCSEKLETDAGPLVECLVWIAIAQGFMEQLPDGRLTIVDNKREEMMASIQGSKDSLAEMGMT